MDKCKVCENKRYKYSMMHPDYEYSEYCYEHLPKCEYCNGRADHSPVICKNCTCEE